MVNRSIQLGCFFFFMLSFSYSSKGQEFVFSSNCVQAYHCFLSMKINEGKVWLSKEIASNPKNLLPYVLVNYEDFVSLSFNENPAEYKLRKPLLNKRLKVIEQGNQQSPYYLFSKGLLYYQWSLIQIKYSDYWNAVWDFRKSYFFFKDNQKKYPTFPYNQVFLGLQEAAISTIPSGYKWATSILGLKGDMKKGIASIKQFIASKQIPFNEEACLYYVYLKNYLENDPEGAFELTKSLNLDIKNNLVFTFMSANLALNNKKAQLAETILENRTKSNAYMAFPMLDYELGDAKLKRLDYNAMSSLQKFVQTYKGNFYIKDAYLSMAFCAYLQGNQKLADSYLLKIKSSGKTESDADKQAQKFALKGKFPDKELLKARLLNDGGYHQQSLEILLKKNVQSFNSAEEKLEYLYRLARVYDDLNLGEKAIQYYDLTIVSGKESTEYFAARAALQAGCIFEKKGQKAKAMQYFQSVLDMDNHDYKNSLDQRAKAGINRLKGV
ncbi:MAG: hypothetical protein KA198_07590 [Chitinophagaceae bacterium]|nr:hypothetical protein [Chitinophagaceae bacterium]